MKTTYTCPMHPEVNSSKKGKCPKCGMDLVEKTNTTSSLHISSKEEKSSYRPLVIIIGLIFLVAFTSSISNFSISVLIERFMIGFFLVFAGFKLIDLKGFASGYASYDLLAQKWYGYGYIYPFIELSFGLLMILGLFYEPVLILEILFMTFSGIGVLIKIAKREKFKCVCLGTLLNVPLTKITLIEDFGMTFLATILLLLT